MESPVEQVGAVPVAPLVGAEQVEIPLVVDDDRVGGGPVAAPSAEALIRGVAVVEVGGVAVGFLLGKGCEWEQSQEKRKEFHMNAFGMQGRKREEILIEMGVGGNFSFLFSGIMLSFP